MHLFVEDAAFKRRNGGCVPGVKSSRSLDMDSVIRYIVQHVLQNHVNCFGDTEGFFMIGRHHRRGLGGFAAGFMGGRGFGGGDFRTGRKLSSADLQLVILALLAEKPRHGYELIKALEERSGGFYVPSPGMIYPALSYLEEIGYATVASDASRKLYSVSDEGRQYLDQNRATTEAILTGLEMVGAKMESVRRVFAGEDPSGDGEYAPGSPEDLYAARRQLKLALHEKRRCSPEEGSRIAAILKRAAAEILGK